MVQLDDPLKRAFYEIECMRGNWSVRELKRQNEDPFASLDQEGVGLLVKIAVEKGRKTKPNLKIGICGEHGGDPASIEFFHRTGLTYVSCSPFRVPIARLAADQAQIRFPRE